MINIILSIILILSIIMISYLFKTLLLSLDAFEIILNKIMKNHEIQMNNQKNINKEWKNEIDLMNKLLKDINIIKLEQKTITNEIKQQILNTLKFK